MGRREKKKVWGRESEREKKERKREVWGILV